MEELNNIVAHLCRTPADIRAALDLFERWTEDEQQYTDDCNRLAGLLEKIDDHFTNGSTDELGRDAQQLLDLVSALLMDLGINNLSRNKAVWPISVLEGLIRATARIYNLSSLELDLRAATTAAVDRLDTLQTDHKPSASI